MKILIVGGGGFVGCWLTHEFLSKKHKVVIVDPYTYYSTWDSKTKTTIEKFKKSLIKGAKVYSKKFEEVGNKVVKNEKPDVVVHLAGIPLEKALDFDISLKQVSEDIGLTYHVVNAVKEHNIKKLVYMSSIAAYGDCDDIITEKAPLIPKTPYGTSKAAGEFLVRAELDNWNVVRSTNIYGFGDMNGRASNIIISKILKKEKFWVNSNIIMDFTYVKDLVSGIAKIALKAPPKEIFHISGGRARKLIDFVKILGKYFELDYDVKEVNDRPKRGTMNNTKALKILKWQPKYTLETAITDYISYIKKYNIA